MKLMIILVIPGKPIVYKPPRVYQTATFNPRTEEKKQIQREIKSQYENDPITDFVHVDYLFVFSVPVSYSKKKQKQALDQEIFPPRFDLSNLVKFYDDCLIDTVLVDDEIIVKETIRKVYGSRDETIIKISKYPLES